MGWVEIQGWVQLNPQLGRTSPHYDCTFLIHFQLDSNLDFANAFKSANSSFTSLESDRLLNVVSLTTPRCSRVRLKCTSARFAYLAATLLASRSRRTVPFTFHSLASRWSGMLNWAETRLRALSAEAVKRKKIFMIFQGANSAVTCHDELYCSSPCQILGDLLTCTETSITR